MLTEQIDTSTDRVVFGSLTITIATSEIVPISTTVLDTLKIIRSKLDFAFIQRIGGGAVRGGYCPRKENCIRDTGEMSLATQLRTRHQRVAVRGGYCLLKENCMRDTGGAGLQTRMSIANSDPQATNATSESSSARRILLAERKLHA